LFKVYDPVAGAASASFGSSSGGNFGCGLQIQAMIWTPGFVKTPDWLAEIPSNENGPKATRSCDKLISKDPFPIT
jgi:hypothetical protein